MILLVYLILLEINKLFQGLIDDDRVLKHTKHNLMNVDETIKEFEENMRLNNQKIQGLLDESEVFINALKIGEELTKIGQQIQSAREKQQQQKRFIVSTHSPFIFSNITDVIICDLDKKLVIRDARTYAQDILQKVV